MANTYEILKKCNAHFSHVGVVAVFTLFFLLIYTFKLCLLFLEIILHFLYFWNFANTVHSEETGHIIPISPRIWRVSYGDTVLHCS